MLFAVDMFGSVQSCIHLLTPLSGGNGRNIALYWHWLHLATGCKSATLGMFCALPFKHIYPQKQCLFHFHCPFCTTCNSELSTMITVAGSAILRFKTNNHQICSWSERTEKHQPFRDVPCRLSSFRASALHAQLFHWFIHRMLLFNDPDLIKPHEDRSKCDYSCIASV